MVEIVHNQIEGRSKATCMCVYGEQCYESHGFDFYEVHLNNEILNVRILKGILFHLYATAPFAFEWS